MSNPQQTALDYLNNWRDSQVKIAELEAHVAELRKLVERTCGDGCHCMDENNERCALVALDKGEV